jgi:hypothetical protein
MATLFETAAGRPELIAEIADAMRGAAPDADPVEFVQRASQDAAFKAALQSRLLRIASAHGLQFMPEAGGAAAAVSVMRKLQQDPPKPQIAVSMPIVFLFVAAALIFAPSVFRSTGGTLFGDSAVADAIEGVEMFPT